MCGLTRYLVPAFLVGLAAATVFANDTYGWIAAGMTVGILAAVNKVRGTTTSCAISLPPSANDQRDGEDAPGPARTR